MKSFSGQERPDQLIDKIERGSWKYGITLTPKQCSELWVWIDEIEDELIERRDWPSIHDDPAKYQDEDGEWIDPIGNK